MIELIVDPEVYRLKFFLENGFLRKECKICKRYFWTIDPDREVCGEAPCVPYSFINNPPTKRSYNIKEMREAFLSFFEKKGHKRVRRYPVIARWRDDIFFTIASIACFQPHVTSGEVPPPYNPLVISQPCIRMTDIGNVGRTGGRHLTIFEMMAHHAFSSKEKEIYWKEETVAYHHEFLTKDLGIPEDEITYIEHWWEGGGDAGPDVEGIVRGLEISTLVFMQYRKIGNTYQELPLKIVDTGYGLERFTWISMGTPTAFEAIYGELFHKFFKIFGFEIPNQRILSEIVKFSGIIDVNNENSINLFKQKVAEATGMDIHSLEVFLKPVESIMAILDHTKALAFMLSDGLVPSNVQGGYFARFLIRRIKRLMDILKVQVPISELISLQISYWKNQFPELIENIDYVLKVVDLEVERYNKTIDHGKNLILKILKEEKIRKSSIFPIEMLLQLYDSHGIPPEMVKEIAEPQGIKVEIPSSFDAMITSLHQSPQIIKVEEDILQGMPQLPETQLLYYINPKANRIKAKVLYSDGKRVVLDRTIFYPEGGGQPSDIGFILTNGKEIKIKNVKKSHGIVVHYVENEWLDVGSEVECIIDLERRKALSKHHSATHVLIGAARRVLGNHVWQHGAQKDVNKSRLDITHFEKISPSQLKEIEILANKVIQECRPIKTYFEDRNKAEEKFGMRLYQGGVVPGKNIRIVEIEDWDVEACGGTHCSNTGEIGLIKIIHSERIQDGVERIEFVAGEQAINYIQSQEEILHRIAKSLNVPIEHIEISIDKLLKELSNYKKLIEDLREKLAININLKPEIINDIKFLFGKFSDFSNEDLLAIASHIVKKDKQSFVILISEKDGFVIAMCGENVIKKGINAGRILSSILSTIGGKGGGKPDIAQGKIPLSSIPNFEIKIQDLKKKIGDGVEF